jgi:hypothetical protein
VPLVFVSDTSSALYTDDERERMETIGVRDGIVSRGQILLVCATEGCRKSAHDACAGTGSLIEAVLYRNVMG